MPQTPGERFLVCSDGVTSELTDARIAAIVLSEPDPNVAVERLIGDALSAGGRDNASAIIVDLPGEADGSLEEATLPRIRMEES
jgi:protein phosphatase